MPRPLPGRHPIGVSRAREYQILRFLAWAPRGFDTVMAAVGTRRRRVPIIAVAYLWFTLCFFVLRVVSVKACSRSYRAIFWPIVTPASLEKR